MNRMVDTWIELLDPSSKNQYLWNSIKEDMINIHDMVKEAESNVGKNPGKNVYIIIF